MEAIEKCPGFLQVWATIAGVKPTAFQFCLLPCSYLKNRVWSHTWAPGGAKIDLKSTTWVNELPILSFEPRFSCSYPYV